VGLSCALGGVLTYPLAMTLFLVSIVIIVASLWGLTGFLVYVYTGQYHLIEVSAIYIGFYVAYLFYFFSQTPTGVVIEAGSTVWRYAGTPNVLLELILVLLLLVPEIVAAILYLSLRRKTDDTGQKYRITLVGGGILLWFALELFVPATTIPWVVFRTLLLVLPALMSLAAYYPPSWARRRYGVTAIETIPADLREGAPSP
jgi:hypothetical protein